MRVLYFNITYECNNECSFCASEHEILKERKCLLINDVKYILEKYSVSAKDKIIINGGEPTVHPQILEIITLIHDRGCKIILFTNGRRLSDIDFAEKLIKAGVDRFTIPIHGTQHVHNAITRRNSYLETDLGILNLKKLKEKYDFLVELKAVICKSNLQCIHKVLEQILMYNVADVILVSTLFQTQTALQNNELVSREEIIECFEKSLEKLRSYNGEVVAYGLPLCMLEKKQIDFILKQKHAEDCCMDASFEEVYVDCNAKEGEIWKEDDLNFCRIKQCQYHNICQVGDVENYKMFLDVLRPSFIQK